MAYRRRVTSTDYPFLSIRVHVRGRSYETLAPVDTGFTGDLVIPIAFLGSAVGLPDAGTDWELADGSVGAAPVYFGMLEIVGLPSVPATVTVLGNEHILGRGVVDRYRVTFDHGRVLTVQP
jgi:predicted aspartyl protease